MKRTKKFPIPSCEWNIFHFTFLLLLDAVLFVKVIKIDTPALVGCYFCILCWCKANLDPSDIIGISYDFLSTNYNNEYLFFYRLQYQFFHQRNNS